MISNHEHYMSQCIDLAKVALKNGESPVGSIIVHDGQIIGTGIEAGKSTGDMTNHAEILSIRSAVSNGEKYLLSQSKMYTTHEPCIMCSYVIRHHKIPHVIYGISVDFVGGHTSGFDVLSTEEVPIWREKPKVTSGISLKECIMLNQVFSKTKKKLP